MKSRDQWARVGLGRVSRWLAGTSRLWATRNRAESLARLRDAIETLQRIEAEMAEGET